MVGIEPHRAIPRIDMGQVDLGAEAYGWRLARVAVVTLQLQAVDPVPKIGLRGHSIENQGVSLSFILLFHTKKREN